MKKYLFLILATVMPFVTLSGKKKEKQNIQVWGEVTTAQDSLDYLTMYKNCPAEVTAQFYFIYDDETKSELYDLYMPDSVAQVNDPVPIERPVQQVVVENIIYSTVQEDGEVYRTSDPDDPVLTFLLADLFDFYHDVFLFDAAHRAHYYGDSRKDEWRSSVRSNNRSKSPDVDLDKVDDTALLIGAAAVAVASAGMLIAVMENMDVPDDRFPYVSISPQVQYFFQTGTVRDVVEFKLRTGNYGGFSFMGDIGYATGSLNHPEVFNPGLTWSVGAGMDIGAFSMSFHFKGKTQHYSENFFSFQLGYDIPVSKSFAIDVRTGVGTFGYNDDIYVDVPVSLGLLWKF